MNKYLKKQPEPINLFTTYLNKDLSNLIYKKRIVIVGPADYLNNQNLGDLIDNYDIIVRIKKGCPIPNEMHKDYGKRTDILYTNLRLDNDTNSLSMEDLFKMKQEGVKYICYPYPTEQNNNIDYRFRKNWKQNSKKINKIIPVFNTINLYDFFLIENYIKSRPTTGLLAILDILKYNPKELFIIGFTFRTEWLNNNLKKNNIYNSYYKNNKQIEYTISTTNNVHSIRNEWLFFQYLLKNIPKLKYHTIENHLSLDR